MIPERIVSLAIDYGGVGAEPFLEEWNGYTVYRLIPFVGYEKMRLGSPILILSNENSERIAEPNEVAEVMKYDSSTFKYDDD